MRRIPLLFLTLGLLLPVQATTTRDLADQARRYAPAESLFAGKLVRAALDRTHQSVRYDPAYLKLAYPGGDVPADTGVCTDEVIRSYRAIGFDLQKLVHEDMRRDFRAYPRNWGLTRPDSNIDHRRVPNLQTFFKRRGAALPITQKAADYLPGDLITCTVAGKLPHIALVVPAPDGGERPWIVHNIGSGPQIEDRLFEFPLTGHYRWHPK
ncbi:MAG: DUF1287 domain-containing protein [Verrucomicrobiaceae bacterium]|nr:DUF1287 domain-containing protein [Verrucomicrobiaceae bacterium]